MTSSYLNLRSEPVTTSKILMIVPPAAALTVSGNAASGYYPVAYGENSGWVLGSGSAVNPFAVSMQDPSGVLSMCNGGDILNGDEDSAGRGFVSRDVLEASKIMQI
jgi:uncharacterized protein YgiM (DUF1202 family)